MYDTNQQHGETQRIMDVNELCLYQVWDWNEKFYAIGIFLQSVLQHWRGHFEFQ
jgi:hypothetical protein